MKKFASLAESTLGISLTPAQGACFKLYEQELLDWNQRMNLTAIRTPEEVQSKHFLDSLSCWLVMREAPCNRVIDVGSGAGFPGIPLKILQPGMQLTLVESIGKKVAFCQHLVQRLHLEHVTVLQERVESLGQQPTHRQAYDWALARAVAVMPVLVEYLLPLVRVGGKMLAMKGESAHREAQQAERAIRLLGGHLSKIVPVLLPGVTEERYLVVVDKVAATPADYPRRVGIPAKKPLA
jgi:16S rRNA (guanine527-N7)-methyltransferase